MNFSQSHVKSCWDSSSKEWATPVGQQCIPNQDGFVGLIMFFLEGMSRRKMIETYNMCILVVTSTSKLLDYEQAYVIASLTLGHQDWCMLINTSCVFMNVSWSPWAATPSDLLREGRLLCISDSDDMMDTAAREK